MGGDKITFHDGEIVYRKFHSHGGRVYARLGSGWVKTSVRLCLVTKKSPSPEIECPDVGQDNDVRGIDHDIICDPLFPLFRK